MSKRKMQTVVSEIQAQVEPDQAIVEDFQCQKEADTGDSESQSQCTQNAAKRKKAYITRTTNQLSRRTKVSLYHTLRSAWDKKFNQNKFFKFRVISRRYMRKLSVETEAESQKVDRKISWDQEIEVVFFKKNQKAEAITNLQRHKDILFSEEVVILV